MGGKKRHGEAEGDETKKKNQLILRVDHSDVATVFVCL